MLVSKKQNIGIMLIFLCTYNWQKFNNKINETKKLGVSEYRHREYVTRQINSRVFELILLIFLLP